jgi:pyruvate,water dikinase
MEKNIINQYYQYNKNDIKLLETCEHNEVGTKVKNLKFIQEKTNYLIPKTIILTTSLYEKLIEYNKIKNRFTFNWKYFRFPIKCENDILKKIKNTFGNKPLVIRSSATCEDSPILSFAGQYSTFLNIKGRNDILNAIRLCCGSLFSENAKVYAEINNVNLKHELMAIAIQEVIPVINSGVIFTVDPISINKNKMIIEYSRGFGDKIISGNKRPKRLEISKINLKQKYPFPFDSLVKIGMDLENNFNHPQDIEWGFDGKKIYIFQSRPITTLKNIPQKTKTDFNKLIDIGSGKIACLGQAQGKLRIVKNPNDYRNIKKNEIIFNNGKTDMRIVKKIIEMAGLITKGGILSHIAVISREFNKPCLVEPINFKALKYNGKNIFLDAIQGKIFLIK